MRKAINMKNRFIILSTLLLIPLLSGCNKNKYDVNKMSVIHDGGYQIFDNFDYSKLKVTYKDIELEQKQYIIDFSNFNTSRVGTSKITVSLAKSKQTSITIPIEVTARSSCNFLLIGDSSIEEVINYTNDIILNNEDSLEINIYGLECDKSTFDTHLDYFAHDTDAYILNKFNIETRMWERSDTLTLKEVLNYRSVIWDVVALQIDNCVAGLDSGYTNLKTFVNCTSSYITSLKRKSPVFAYSLPWAYQDNVSLTNDYYEYFNNSQIEMYKAIASKTRDNVETSNLFNFVIPTGTIVQNLRSSNIVTEKEFTTDGMHLDTKYASYATCLGLISKLSGLSPYHFSYRGVESSEIVNKDEQEIIYQAIESSLSNPYSLDLTE